MVRKLIGWGIDNPLIVIILALALAGFGSYAFLSVNVEAYPDPAPAIVEIVTQVPGASAEEVERQVTIPLEVALAGMPGLKYTRSKSLFGLSHIRNQFDYGIDFERAKQEVLNRLSGIQLPNNWQPQISPATPTGEIYRYVLRSPLDAAGNPVYTLNDLKSLQNWVLERELRRVPRIAGVASHGGTVKRYEVQPDPDRLRRYGVTLAQLQAALANSNTSVGGDILIQGDVALTVRSIALIGGGRDPVTQVLGMKDPAKAAAVLRAEERKRLKEIRQLVIATVNNVPVRVEHIVEGGPVPPGEEVPDDRGVVVGWQTRMGRSAISRPRQGRDEHGVYRLVDKSGKVLWRDVDEVVHAVVLLRKGEDTLPALHDLKEKIKELNEPGKLLPGVKIEPYSDRTDLIHVTTETVRENLLMGMGLVVVILLMFLSNVRSALIVAINIPLALLFAYAALYVRGKSANLLSMGAVDFGIIVDSSVIMVENIYRHLTSGDQAELPLRDRILHACRDVEKPLLFSTLIMVCGFLPLFTMKGPEGQIFGPMAQTYAFALGGALLLAMLLAPVLCLMFFRHLKPAGDNVLVRWLKRTYLRWLTRCLDHRYVTLAGFAALLGATALIAIPRMGREFMPPLEEGNTYIRGTFPLNVTLERVGTDMRQARAILRSFPEVEAVIPIVGRPDDGTDPTGYYNAEIYVPLKLERFWPAVEPASNWWQRLWNGKLRPRTKDELIDAMKAELKRKVPGVDWNFSQGIRDNVMEALSGVKGDNSVKIFGPDLAELERLGARLRNLLKSVRGMEDVAVFSIQGQSNLEMRVDADKCAKWGVSVADVNNVVQTALGARPLSVMIEGERMFDIAVRWPPALRNSETAILDIPVDVTNNTVAPPTGGPGTLSPAGSAIALPAVGGALLSVANQITNRPRVRLRDLVSPVGPNGGPDPYGSFQRPGASTVYREQGNRMIAVKFSVRGRDLASAVAEAKDKAAEIIKAPYRLEWSGEFQEMEEAESRLLIIVPVALGLIFMLLYMAFHSLIDAGLVLMNVMAMSIGGIWALYLTGTNFSISAAVGFVSIFGVAITDGLLLVSSFNYFRGIGTPLREAILRGAELRVRPVTMTELTAILGLLPAALSSRIGSQTQQPLAIVVVGGMTMALLLTRYLTPVLYSFYGHREPPHSGGGLAH
jgi:cobalt-zinc-cadmium resistance protein CzcA